MAAMEVLERLRDLGFQFMQLPRYDKQVAVERSGFVALLEYTPAGEIRQFSSAGYLLEGQVAMMVERGGGRIFQLKQNEVAATPEMLEQYERFKDDLQSALELNHLA